MLRDSRAVALIVSEGVLPVRRRWQVFPICGTSSSAAPRASGGFARRSDGKERRRFHGGRHVRRQACFWLYSSGSTGVRGNGAHPFDLEATADSMGSLCQHPRTGRRVSGPKLFFAYGLATA
jgi:hypothetical protein